MAELMKKKSSRVEQRGRFTITELEPESPASSANGEPHSYVQDGDTGVGGPDIVHESGEGEGGDEADGRGSIPGDAGVPTASERISPFGSAVFERSNGAVRVADSDTAEGEAADSAVSGTETTAGDAETALENGDRRVKRKGRFTIIELSSDSPRSRRDSAEEFSTTTSISVTSTQVSQANALNLSSSPSSSGLLAVSHGGGSSTNLGNDSTNGSTVFARGVSESTAMMSRSGRMMPGVSGGSTVSRGRSANFSRASSSRMRSVSPVRDPANHNGYQANQQQHQLSASFGSTPYHPPSYNASPLIKAAQPSPSQAAAVDALASSFSSVSGMSGNEKPPPVELGANRRHLVSRQKAITISAEQFIQQQQTIASLIRQQQELKQLIGVLQEQQHHLMTIPMPMNEFMLDQAHSNAQEDTMREVQIQVTTLSRANDALQSLLSQAEQDAHERTMEIECLSDENSVIRHRYMKLEQKYHDERKHSLKLEHELVATRRALNSRLRNEQSGYNVQKQQHKLSSRNSSRRVDDPIEPEPAIQKSV